MATDGPPSAPTPIAASAGDGPALTVAAVARRLGVAPATLRTWDRRYGLGPSEHSAGSHRRYTADDVARLLVMRGLTLDGVAPSEAARVALESDIRADEVEPSRRRLVSVGGGGAGAHDSSHATPTLVIDAALRGDEDACRRLLAPPEKDDYERWWAGLVEPARAGLVARTVLARPGEDADALVVEAVLAGLRARTAPLARAHVAGRRVVLLMAAPDEPRPLVLHVLGAALAAHGVDARIVAGPVEQHRIIEIAAMTRPAAAAMVSELADPELAAGAALADAQPDVPQFIVLADDAAARSLPLGRSVHRARTFAGVLAEVLAVSA
ncbi:MerR family transcriptional regulator [Cellulomonas timonensis]|uniref:MerR family transcriptional regulator n=1 Tax=Cellulomonas timonensis TaxID=1689271 RepID=UPI00082D89B5|nr:MerR family transcriptional regulator [Cellulomonas timonensis]